MFSTKGIHRAGARLTCVLVGHCTRLFHEIDLKAHDELDLVARIPGNWNHSEQIHEWLSSSPIIDQADLRFLLGYCHLLQVKDRFVVDVSTFDPRFHFSIGGLQESTVPAQDHVFAVACESLKVLGAVDNWLVVLFGVTNHECAREIHRADIDLGVWPGGYPHLHTFVSAP
jgi:hypothetical protein